MKGFVWKPICWLRNICLLITNINMIQYHNQNIINTTNNWGQFFWCQVRVSTGWNTISNVVLVEKSHTFLKTLLSWTLVVQNWHPHLKSTWLLAYLPCPLLVLLHWALLHSNYHMMLSWWRCYSTTPIIYCTNSNGPFAHRSEADCFITCFCGSVWVKLRSQHLLWSFKISTH